MLFGSFPASDVPWFPILHDKAGGDYRHNHAGETAVPGEEEGFMVHGPLLVVILAASVLFIVAATAKFKLHPFLALLAAAFLVGLLVRMPLGDLVTTINTGFGNMMRQIGLVIVIGTIIGVFLEKSGAALRMAETVLRVVGEKRPQIAMSLIGAVVSVPVFCDSGYVILSSLNKAIARRARVPLASMAVALAMGLYSTHTLIPPTPGPIAAAGNIGAADYLGLVMLFGLLVSVPAIAAGYFWATRVAARIAIADENEDVSPDENGVQPESLPSAWKAFTPIAAPVVLIAAGSVISALKYEGFGAQFGLFLGAPVVALIVGLLFALLLPARFDMAQLNAWTAEGIRHAAPILLITGAGGAFGAVLSATPLAELIKGLAGGGLMGGPFVLLVPFVVAACLKTAQGSTTAALVVTSALVAPFLPELGVTSPVQLALMVMAIGSGGMIVSHANDSYFWVVAQFSGLAVKDAYKAMTPATLVQGLAAFTATFLLYLVLV